MQTILFTPLSIRRGGGGEASSFPLGEAGWGFLPRASVPTLWYLLLFSLAVPVNEAMPYYMPPPLPFLCKRYYSLPSPFGEGAGVRLLLSPWGRLGGVSRRGRLSLLGGVGGVRTLPLYTPISPYIIRKSTLILMSSRLRYH